MKEKLIDRIELSQLIGNVSKTTLYRWRNERGMPHYAGPGKILYKRSEVEAWLKKQGKKSA